MQVATSATLTEAHASLTPLVLCMCWVYAWRLSLHRSALRAGEKVDRMRDNSRRLVRNAEQTHASIGSLMGRNTLVWPFRYSLTVSQKPTKVR